MKYTFDNILRMIEKFTPCSQTSLLFKNIFISLKCLTLIIGSILVIIRAQVYIDAKNSKMKFNLNSDNRSSFSKSVFAKTVRNIGITYIFILGAIAVYELSPDQINLPNFTVELYVHKLLRPTTLYLIMLCNLFS